MTEIDWNETAWRIRNDQVWVFKKEQQNKVSNESNQHIKYDEYCMVVYKFHPWYREKRDIVADQILGSGFKYSDYRYDPPIISVTGKKLISTGNSADDQKFDVFSFVADIAETKLLIRMIRVASDYSVLKSKDGDSSPKLEFAERHRPFPRDLDLLAFTAANILFDDHPIIIIREDKFLSIFNTVHQYAFLSPGVKDIYDNNSKPSHICTIHTSFVPVYTAKELDELKLIFINIVKYGITFPTYVCGNNTLTYRGKVAISIAARFLCEDFQQESPENWKTETRKTLPDDLANDQKTLDECEKFWKSDRVHNAGNYNFFVGDISKVMRTIASVPDEKLAENYVEFLKHKDFSTSLSERGQNLTAWENTFRSTGFPTKRIELLMELWKDLTMRQVDEWIGIGLQWKEGTSYRQRDLIHRERNMRAHMFEMLDFADRLATYNKDLAIVARDLRIDVERKVKSAEVEKNLSLRSKMYTLNTVWANIGNEMEEQYVRNISEFYKFNESQETNALQLLQERKMQLSRLRDIQKMIEKVLDYDNYDQIKKMADSNNPVEMIGRTDVKNVSLHKTQPMHLFTTNTYRKLKDKILDFMKETRDMKEGHVYLLRLRFEQAALQEVVRRLFEMIDDVNDLGKLIQNENASDNLPVFFDGGLGLLENLEWECTRTWQQVFETDPVFERRRWDAVIKYVNTPNSDKTIDSMYTEVKKILKYGFDSVGYGVISAISGLKNGYGFDSAISGLKKGAYKKIVELDTKWSEPIQIPPKTDPFKERLMRGGAPPPPNMPSSFFDAESSTDGIVDRSSVQSSIDHWKSAARRLFVKLRAAIAEASFHTTPGNNTLIALFIQGEVAPRLAAFSDAVNDAMRVYLKPTAIDPAENLAVKRAEKRQKEIARSGYRITVTDSIRFRISDPSMQLLLGLKMIRFVGQIAASWAARRAYSDEFTKTVLVDGKAPPPLTKMLFAFLGIDATLQLFALGGLVMSSHLLLDRREPSSNVYVIDDDFIQAFLIDYFVTTVAIGVLAYIIASLMRKKSYFHLAEDGERTATAYGWSLVGISGAIAIIPPLSL